MRPALTAPSHLRSNDINDNGKALVCGFGMLQRLLPGGMIQAGFVDPFSIGGFAPMPTSPSEQPQERIDFVWLRGLQPTAAQVLESVASDHRMVVVTARLD